MLHASSRAGAFARAFSTASLKQAPPKAAAVDMKYFKIYRWDPEVAGQKPYMATYAVNLKECAPAARASRARAVALTPPTPCSRAPPDAAR